MKLYIDEKDSVFFVCNQASEAIRFSGVVRQKIAEELDLIDKKNLDSKKKILSGKIKKKIYDLSTFDKSKISKIKSKLLEYVF